MIILDLAHYFTPNELGRRACTGFGERGGLCYYAAIPIRAESIHVDDFPPGLSAR